MDDGWKLLPGFASVAEAQRIAAMYVEAERFRSRVVMARHGFGRGEYQYFRYALPEPVATWRRQLYGELVATANAWSTQAFPAEHAAFLRRCHDAGQVRPTPLLLQYGAGDYNCLHQDLYGENVFPIQVAVLLSEPGRDFTGGELVLTEQRPRRQSRAIVVPWRQGDAVAFAVAKRPRGYNMRHGVSMLHGGRRHTLGIIFHDAT